ncbi:MAG TPA: cell division protein FtsZ [Bryobacteraceae bacterium]|nr:cell division protein FtsZ [Bryobacteraceae bacterium]HOQ46839.1 cell division protein FtsZ [Bryobacteraceae bacterium]HPQ15539.1 cell division protein FtsZ [Bryobacteraceae bacterium]HPU73629.1 cell division protein FtsZ [Bryobacteraceae bacterium]
MDLLDANVGNLKYELQDDTHTAAKIKVIGVGGGGSNAVAHMMEGGLEGVEFYVVNTDVQALQACPVQNKLAIGCKITHGRGTGADPSIGRQAALDDTERICEILEGADLVFVAAGLGGGTGSGAAPVIASLGKEMGALTMAVATKPFTFEGARRRRQAEKGLEELAAIVDAVITVSNDRLLTLAPRGTSLVEAFRMGHDFLRRTVSDIVEIMTTPGFINRDFSDVRSTMFGAGCALLGTATASGEGAAVKAAKEAIGCPLLEGAGIKGAQSVLLNIVGSSRLGLHDVHEACELIRAATENEDVEVNFGVVLNEAMEDSVKVTVIATGFARQRSVPARELEPEEEPVAAAAQTLWLSEMEPERAAAAPPVAPEPEPPAAPRATTGYPVPPPAPAPVEEEEDLNDLDTPAYLRRRALQ